MGGRHVRGGGISPATTQRSCAGGTAASPPALPSKQSHRWRLRRFGPKPPQRLCPCYRALRTRPRRLHASFDRASSPPQGTGERVTSAHLVDRLLEHVVSLGDRAALAATSSGGGGREETGEGGALLAEAATKPLLHGSGLRTETEVRKVSAPLWRSRGALSLTSLSRARARHGENARVLHGCCTGMHGCCVVETR